MRRARQPLGPSLLALGLVAGALAGCGTAAHKQQPTTYPAVVREFGRPAGAADGAQIAALVKRYYAAAAAGDGAKACAMLFFALEESVAERYHWAPAPRYLNGADSCQAVLARVFAHFHAQLQIRPTVVLVRVEGNLARALLTWPPLPQGYVEARREGARWKLDSLLAAPVA
jgi:hypothetical protein